MPWLKHINLFNGKAQSFPLDPARERVVSEFGGAAGNRTLKVVRRGNDWFCVGVEPAVWLTHGSEIDTGNGIYVFMERPEFRHPEMEQAVARSSDAVHVYADWLEEKGDAFAECLKPQLVAQKGPAGLWWMEGLERVPGLFELTVRDGFVRRVTLLDPSKVRPSQLIERLLLRLCHLRACCALEELSVHPRWLLPEDARVLGPDAWHRAMRWNIWTTCPWPGSLKRLTFFDPAYPRAPAEALYLLQAKLRKRNPDVVVDGGGEGSGDSPPLESPFRSTAGPGLTIQIGPAFEEEDDDDEVTAPGGPDHEEER